MKLSDEQLLGAVSAAEASAIGAVRGEIASDRADAVDRYLGKAYGNEQPGRSGVVSRDVADVVEGVLANVIKPFVAGDQVVQFTPRGPEDEQAAQQESDYINFVALERNNGFHVLTSSIKDALIVRNGYIKCGWRVRSDVMRESYEGLTDDELMILLQDPAIEVVEHSEYPDPTFAPPPMPAAPAMMMGQGPMSPPQAPSLHDIKVRRKSATEYAEMMAVPPDEMLVSERTTSPSLQDTDFVQHRTHKSLSELRQMGYDVDDDLTDDDGGETLEEYSRDRFGSGDKFDDETNDPSRRLVLFKETWIRIDRDGDGVAELRRVCSVGQKLLADDECEFVPVACFTGTIMSHQHLGISVYDMVQDLAQLKTALLRQFMDNKYLANNQRVAVDVDSVNIDDLAVSRPGGVVRVRGNPADKLFPIVAPDTGASALQALEYLDSVRENRTGFTRYAQGMQSDSLINKTATGLMAATSQSQMRLELVARTIAETGIRDLFGIIHALTLKHSTKKEKVQLRGKWVEVNPREWVRRTDLQISVGLGAGNSDQQLGKLMALAPFQQQLMAMGLVGPQEVYNLAVEIYKASGYKNPDKFVKAPQLDENGQPKAPPPQKDPLVQAEEVKGQIALQKMDKVDATEIEKTKIVESTKLQIARAENALKGADLGLKVQQQDHDQRMDKVHTVTDNLHRTTERFVNA